MQGQDVSAMILLEMENIMMHRFVKNNKTLFTSGLCKIAKIENSNSTTVYFINLNSFYYTLNRAIVFIRLEYSDTVSYLFPHFDNGMSSITLPIHSSHILTLQEILRNAAVLTTMENALSDPSLRAKIEEHCPGIEKEQIYNPDKVKQTITTGGKMLGQALKVIGGYLSQGVSVAGQYIHDKVGEGKTQISPETKQKWQNLKKGTNEFVTVNTARVTEMMSPYVGPVYQLGCEYVNDISRKIETSENPNIVYARELGQTSTRAAGEVYKGLAEGTSTTFNELGKQSKRIATKSLGEDTVNTIIGPNEESKKQEGGPTLSGERQDQVDSAIFKAKIDMKKEENSYPDLDEKEGHRD